MRQDKIQRGAKRLVWRMDALHPGGAFIDPNEPIAHPPKPPEASLEGWLDSSLALLDGLQVSEVPLSSMPGDMYDDFGAGRH